MSSQEDREAILTELDPEWMERFAGNVDLATQFYMQYNRKAWDEASQWLGLSAAKRKDPKRVE